MLDQVRITEILLPQLLHECELLGDVTRGLDDSNERTPLVAQWGRNHLERPLLTIAAVMGMDDPAGAARAQDLLQRTGVLRARAGLLAVVRDLVALEATGIALNDGAGLARDAIHP